MEVLETFKPIKGYEGIYEISDYGCVRSRHGGKVRYLKCKKGKNRYIQVALWKNGKKKRFQLHRLVWEAFRSPIPDGYEIDHINTVRDDNRLSNLRCVTPSENNRNPITAERMREANRRLAEDPQWRQKNCEKNRRLAKDPKWRHRQREGVRKSNSKPLLQINRDTGEIIKRWECISDAERVLGVHHSSISQCFSGKRKTAGGYRWCLVFESCS